MRTGSNKVVASEDLPDLPFYQVKKLKKAIKNIAVKGKAQVMNLDQVNEVRREFFNFFMEPLKKFNFTEYLNVQRHPLTKTDLDSLFSLKPFIQKVEDIL